MRPLLGRGPCPSGRGRRLATGGAYALAWRNFQNGEFSYDVMSEGEWFVVIRSRRAARASSIVLVQGFSREPAERSAR